MQNKSWIKLQHVATLVIWFTQFNDPVVHTLIFIPLKMQANCEIWFLKFLEKKVIVFGLEGNLRGLHRVNPVCTGMKLMRSSLMFWWELQAQIWTVLHILHSHQVAELRGVLVFGWTTSSPLGLLYHALRERKICRQLYEPFYYLTESLQF